VGWLDQRSAPSWRASLNTSDDGSSLQALSRDNPMPKPLRGVSDLQRRLVFGIVVRAAEDFLASGF
jgi:hypothetical protein